MDGPVAADALDVIARVPALAGTPRVVTELPGGLTNRNYKVATPDGTFVARLWARSGGDDLLAINRGRPAAAARRAAVRRRLRHVRGPAPLPRRRPGRRPRRLAALVSAYYGRDRPGAVARARLFTLVAQYGWTLWGVLQHARSPLAFDFRAWALERFEAAAAGLSSPSFSQLLEDVSKGD